MMLYMRSDTPYPTLAGIHRAKEPPKCGSSGTNDAGFLLPKVLEETFGIKFNVVSGYTGGNQIDLAVGFSLTPINSFLFVSAPLCETENNH